MNQMAIRFLYMLITLVQQHSVALLIASYFVLKCFCPFFEGSEFGSSECVSNYVKWRRRRALGVIGLD